MLSEVTMLKSPMIENSSGITMEILKRQLAVYIHNAKIPEWNCTFWTATNGALRGVWLPPCLAIGLFWS